MIGYEYIPTNPRGYAEWFRERMQANSKRSLFDSIERVPTYPKKTILQKAIQLLKRYRDVYFANKDDDLKPISMIITTLVAKCYNGEQNLYDFILHSAIGMEHQSFGIVAFCKSFFKSIYYQLRVCFRRKGISNYFT